jgi:hypothetical protein
MLSRSRAKVGALLAVSAVSAVALAGCGTKTLDEEQLQSKIVDMVVAQGNVKAKDLKVSCPKDQEAKTGNAFTCTITNTALGVQGKVEVTATSDSGGVTATIPADQKITTVAKGS